MADIAYPSFISRQVVEGRYFFLDLAPPASAELSAVCGGREQCTATYAIDRGDFAYHALEFVAAGSGELEIAGQRFGLQAGSVFAYGPRIAHQIRATGKSPLIKYFVDFAGTQAEASLSAISQAGYRPLRLVRSRWIHDLFDQLLESGTDSKRVARETCALILRLLLKRLAIDAQQGDEAESAAFETYCRCRRHMEENLAVLARISDAAAACGVAPAYLSRLFKRYANEGPHQYLTRLRMDRAADLLIRGGSSVADVAALVGYSDPFHFSRVFKRVQGAAPGRFARSVMRHAQGGDAVT